MVDALPIRETSSVRYRDSGIMRDKIAARRLHIGVLMCVLVFLDCEKNAAIPTEKEGAVRRAVGRRLKGEIHLSSWRLKGYVKGNEECVPGMYDASCRHQVLLHAYALPGLMPKGVHLLRLPEHSSFSKLDGCPYFQRSRPDIIDMFYNVDPVQGVKRIPESTAHAKCSIPIKLGVVGPSASHYIMGEAAEGRWLMKYRHNGIYKRFVIPIPGAAPSNYHSFNRGRSIMLADKNGRLYVVRDINFPRIEHIKEIQAHTRDDIIPIMFGDPASTSVFVSLPETNVRMKYRIMRLDPITGRSNFQLARRLTSGYVVYYKELGMLVTPEANARYLRIMDSETGKTRHRFELPSDVRTWAFRSLYVKAPNILAVFDESIIDLKKRTIVGSIPGFDSIRQGGAAWAPSPSGRTLCWSMSGPAKTNPWPHLQFLHIQCYDLELKESYGPVRIKEIALDPAPSFPMPQRISQFIWIDDKTFLAVVSY